MLEEMISIVKRSFLTFLVFWILFSCSHTDSEFDAQGDIQNGTIHLISYGLSLPLPPPYTNYNRQVDSLRKVYGIEYENCGCIADSVLLKKAADYNKIVIAYLAKRNGAGWFEKYNRQVDSLYMCAREKEYRTKEKQFFDYDQIDHYSIYIPESGISELFNNQHRSEKDSLKMGVVLRSIPKSITDTTFIPKLETIGYSKKSLSKTEFAGIDSLFAKKDVRDTVATACVFVYRDILIFKKRNKIAGTAKICFACRANEIQGASIDPSGFGQNGEYEVLKKLLKR